jgi:glycosyltransferase involved in cell wall biosynthesis
MSDSTAHDFPRIWWKEWIKKRVVRMFSAAVVAGGPHISYIEALGIPRTHAFVGYDVVDNNYFSVYADKARACDTALKKLYKLPARYFLASNRFIEKKNLERLLDAYAVYVIQAGAASWDLVLLGDGPLTSSLVQQVRRLGLTDRVLLPGFKQYDELPIFYGLASVFIHASTSEQWGLVVNEAMASGLPVLVSDRCGCTPDLVQNGVNGFTFDPFNINEITSLMLQMSDGNSDLILMGQCSREIISHWSTDTFASCMKFATDSALSAPKPKVGWVDRALLWLIMRR